MKKILLFIYLFVFIFQVFGQKNKYREPYSQKFYKLNNEVYGIKYPKKIPDAYLYSLSRKTYKVNQKFPYSYFGLMSALYPNLIYDINTKDYIVLTKMRMGPEIGSESINLYFFLKKNLLNKNSLKK